MVAIDNTWSAGVFFDALAHGVDITLQALTKYVGGHSDLLLGSVTVRDESTWNKLGAAQQVLGFAASPDDCTLALRGMKTLAVRLREIEGAALHLARWLAECPEIERVLHPALDFMPRARSMEARLYGLIRGFLNRVQTRIDKRKSSPLWTHCGFSKLGTVGPG